MQHSATAATAAAAQFRYSVNEEEGVEETRKDAQDGDSCEKTGVRFGQMIA